MRALLINPWIYDFAAYDLWSKPIGLLSIAAYLQKLGCEIRLIDCLDRLHPALSASGYTIPKASKYGSGGYCSEEIPKPSVIKNIPRTFKRYGIPFPLFETILATEPDPDVILVTSGMTYWYPACVDIIASLKQRFSCPVILGGNYANLCYDHACKHSGADAVYKGQDIVQIVRLINRTAGAKLDCSALCRYKDLRAAYELYNALGYVTLRTSRGCPFKCTYCGWYLLESSFSRRDPETVVSEIEYFHKEMGVNNFSFYDDALLYEAESHIIKILRSLIKKHIQAHFHTPNGLHNRFMTAELAGLLHAAGFVHPRLALETSSPALQKRTSGKTTNEEYLAAVTSLKNAGYAEEEIGTYILIGLPGQTMQEIEESIRFAARQGCRVFLEEYSPIPGTPCYTETGLPADADPLLHNNSAFPLYKPAEFNRLQELKDLAHALNSGIQRR